MRQYYKLLILTILAGALFSSAFLFAENIRLLDGQQEYVEHTSTQKELEKTCADLTKNDPEGKIYEPIVGKYVKEKSFTAVEEPSNSSALYSIIITFVNNNHEASVYSEETSEKKYNENYFPVLKKLFHDRPDLDFVNNIYGVCGYKIKHSLRHYKNESPKKYIANINSLVLLKERK